MSTSKKAFSVAKLSVIHVHGADAEKFLQSQLTADVTTQPNNSWLYAGHCDAKGKLWSVMRVVKIDADFYLIMPTASEEQSLAQFKKYAVFSKVEFTDINSSHSVVLDPTSQKPVYKVENSSTSFSLGLGDATLSVSESPDNSTLDEDNEAWLAYEIEHGVPCLTPATGGEFIPQMVGLDLLNGINFQKGCYIGQESVARMHYLGQNKREPRLVVGQSAVIPAAGALLERQIGESWRRAGAVLNAVRYHSGEVAILAVLPADIEDSATLRIKGEETSQLALRPKFDNQEISNE